MALNCIWRQSLLVLPVMLDVAVADVAKRSVVPSQVISEVEECVAESTAVRLPSAESVAVILGES